VHEVAREELDPDRRIVAMLGARGSIRGKTVAKTAAPKTETQRSARVK